MHNQIIRFWRMFREEGHRLWHENRGEFWHRALFWTFWLSLATFPVGYGAREVFPLLCAIFLVGYYRHAWARSVWRRLGVRPLFYSLWAMIVLGVIFSGDVWSSLLHAGTGLNKGFILPIIAMECVRDVRDLKRLVWACVAACIWQGLDGIWQAWTGYDFIMGYGLNAGRLTGSLGDYTVGNYIALAIIPALSCFYLLRQRLSPLKSFAGCVLLLSPAFFLLQGANSRSGVLAVASALVFWWLLVRRKSGWPVLAGVGIMLGYMLLPASRLVSDSVVEDGRWSLWHLGWEVFCAHPLLGAGAGQYNAAFRALGLSPAKDVITITHPHNLYLDILYAHGIIGFALGMIFLAGFAWWGYRRIGRRLAGPESRTADGRLYWVLAGWFWVGYIGWLVNGIFGHDFYRIWWLALAMCYLGIFTGAVVNGVPAGEDGPPEKTGDGS